MQGTSRPKPLLLSTNNHLLARIATDGGSFKASTLPFCQVTVKFKSNIMKLNKRLPFYKDTDTIQYNTIQWFIYPRNTEEPTKTR